MEITQDKLDEIKEQSWLQGERAALVRQLREALNGLGYSEEFTTERLIMEREVTIVALRSVCDEFGDNDWNENLHLSDVVNKHLREHLENGTHKS